MSQRKTAAEKRMEKDDDVYRAKRQFLKELQQVQCVADAWKLVNTYISPQSLTRPFHSNFAFFMDQIKLPNGASSEELIEYKRIVSCFRQEGSLGEEILATFEAAFKTESSRHSYKA